VPVMTLTKEITVTSATTREEAEMEAVALATAAMPDVKEVKVKQVKVVVLKNAGFAGYRVTLEITHGSEAESVTERGEPRVEPRRVWSRSYPPSHLDLVRQRVLLEDLDQEALDKSDRFLTIIPAEKGSGSSDVSINHDRYLFED
jgi:hypothetical protein